MGSGAKRRHRHRKLHGKARRAEILTQKLAQSLSTPEPDARRLQVVLGQLSPVLVSLRRSTLREDGPQARVVAEGIQDLTAAFEFLVKSNQVSNPQQAASHLSAGSEAFERAVAKAQEAGDAWPL